MSPKNLKNVPESVKRRLLNQARSLGIRVNDIWVRYGMERFLYRLGESKHRNLFTLKGAMLFHLWFDEGQRSTKDIDLRGEGDSSIERIEAIMKEICQLETKVDDGLVFQIETIKASKIKEGMKYEGVRVTFQITLGKIRIPMQIDVGFGDAISEKVQLEELSSYLDMPGPKIRAYPKETVIAEKFEAMVNLGLDNTRLKDFYDVWKLSQAFEFESIKVAKAIQMTFEKRETDIPSDTPLAFTSEFYNNPAKQKQWLSFLRKTGVELESTFEEVCLKIKEFIIPVITEVNQYLQWKPNNGWD